MGGEFFQVDFQVGGGEAQLAGIENFDLVALSAEQIGKYVKNPKGVNPKAMMPSQKDNLSERELEEVAKFLANMK